MSYSVVVLVSGGGTLLQSLIDHLGDDTAASPDINIVAVGADRSGIEGLARAERAGIPTFVHPFERGSDRARWDAELADLVARHDPDLVVSAGFMKLLGPAFLARFGGRTINTHPALLPSFPGMHGPRDALAHGVKVSGATVFMVDEGIDTGGILAQGAVPVRDNDSVETLHERIKAVEQRLLVQVVEDLARQAGSASSDHEAKFGRMPPKE